LIKRGKLSRFTRDTGQKDEKRKRNSPRKSSQSRESPDQEESSPRKEINVSEGRTKVPNSTCKAKDRCPFLGAIMGGFAAPQNATKGMERRKITQLMAVHATTTIPKAGGSPISRCIRETRIKGDEFEAV